MVFANKLIADQQHAETETQLSSPKFSIEIDKKTTEKAREILEEIRPN